MKTTKNFQQILWGIIFLSQTISCGSKSDRPDSDTGFLGTGFGAASAVSIEQTLADDELATGEINAHVESAIDGLEGDIENAEGASLYALDASAEGRFIRYRKCTEVEDTAQVDIAHGLSLEISRDLPKSIITHSIRSLHKRKHVWAKDGESVECHAGGKYPVITFANLAGMTLDMDFTRRYLRSGQIKLKNSNLTFSRAVRAEVNGERHINFASVTDSGDNKIISKSMTMDINSKAEVKNLQGTYRLMERTVEVSDENPLEIDIERDASDYSVQSRTIKTGKVKATGKQGGHVEISFVNVKYTPASGCMPVSGTINGGFFKPDSTTADRSFTITFNGSEAEVVFGDGKKRAFSPNGCWLDRPSDSGSISDVNSQEEVESEIQ